MIDDATDRYREPALDGVPPDCARVARLIAEEQIPWGWPWTGEGSVPEAGPTIG